MMEGREAKVKLGVGTWKLELIRKALQKLWMKQSYFPTSDFIHIGPDIHFGDTVGCWYG